MRQRERFVLTVEIDAGDVPAMIRLRAALKTLLRGYGIRCVEAVRPQPAATGPGIGVGRSDPGKAVQAPATP